MKRLTTDEIIKRFKDIHGDKYDYSLVEYKNNRTKVKIICSEHGVFEQVPPSHLFGYGCIICGYFIKNENNKRRLTTEKIIEKFKNTHGNKYNYSLVDYKNGHNKVKIVCSEHGVFEQKPNNHIILKQGCPECYGNKKLKTDKFIKKSKEIHGDKYNYSLVDYKNNFTKVKIICPNHGVFEQKPNGHLIQKSGCLKCSGKNKKTTKEFILLSKNVHGDKYDYSLVDYKNGHDKVKIICKNHGIFDQRPGLHTNGKHGCPICKSSKGEKMIQLTLEKNNIKYIKEYIFDDCKFKSHLRFDFYLPKYNICIEYDGIQHFEIVDYWGGIETLNLNKKKDKLKNDYCKKNDIKLIRIKYNRKLESENILERIY